MTKGLHLWGSNVRQVTVADIRADTAEVLESPPPAILVLALLLLLLIYETPSSTTMISSSTLSP